eukprot:gene29227-38295_t
MRCSKQRPLYSRRDSVGKSFALAGMEEPYLQKELQIKPFISKLYTWLQTESLSALLPKSDALNIIQELRANDDAMLSLYRQYNTLWETLFQQIAAEKRSVKEILGPELSSKILKSVESTDLYDPATVQSFVKNPVFESMLGSILYEGIFEFLQRVDILGNIVNNLPIIGPIRVAIVKEFKSSLDKTVGGQIKTFLSGFNKVAVQRMVDFILAPKNRAAFSTANRNVLDALMSKPLDSILPNLNDDSNNNINPLRKVKADLWLAIQDTPLTEIDSLLDKTYEKVGAEQFDTAVQLDIEKTLERAPTLSAVAERNLVRLLQSDLGQKAFADLQQMYNAANNNKNEP